MRSGRIQASYVHPLDGVRYYALHTYDNRMDAEAWLAQEKRLIEMETWTPPEDRAKKAQASSITVEEYTRKWIEERPLAEGTRELYKIHARKRINRSWARPRWPS
ncbi:integrase [Mycobacterium phage BTCU-1]|uniref:Integrase n=1 Tax=Mycobacterium phage BTCU-1 TaxID=1262532 RepID=R9R498_9CAUD|nr:integrase [Mycobacterium phage BTCU-1]AGI61714.1 integrase [Mycobacterium phage BTCU-1]